MFVMQEVEQDEQAQRLQRLRPAVAEGDAQKDGADGRQPGADVGDVAEDGAENAPQPGVRHADQPQPQGDDEAERAVDEELHQEVTPDAAGGLAQRLGAAGHVARAEHSQHPVPQILVLRQHEDHQHHDDANIDEHFQGRGEAPLHQRPPEIRRVARRGLRRRAGGGGLLGHALGFSCRSSVPARPAASSAGRLC